ncbi:MAG TPA: hypothetical protein VNT30_23425 [Stellaceae bacterium]|nr:hypothetical protein [Stellaceae bacterium]
MDQTWRWFAPKDPVPLAHLRQAGTSGMVTVPHQRPDGVVYGVVRPVERLS